MSDAVFFPGRPTEMGSNLLQIRTWIMSAVFSEFQIPNIYWKFGAIKNYILTDKHFYQFGASINCPEEQNVPAIHQSVE